MQILHNIYYLCDIDQYVQYIKCIFTCFHIVSAKYLLESDIEEIGVMVFKASFNNISVLLVEENEVSGENNRPVASHLQTLSHNVVSNTPRHERDSNS